MAASDESSVPRFKGFCFDYDRFRPVPPGEIMDLGQGWAGKTPLDLVVDLGCGTGLSTRPWAKRAHKVIGLDPSPDMLEAARSATNQDHIEFRLGTGQRTELENACADIVTCSSAAHWMDPHPTVAEVARIMRNGGVFIVYGHYFPVFVNSYHLTAFYEKWRKNLDELEYIAEKQVARKWPLTELYAAVAQCGQFLYTRRHYLHSRICWSSEEVEGFFRAHAGVPFLLQRGYKEADLLLPELAGLVSSARMHGTFDAHLTYSVFLAVKA